MTTAKKTSTRQAPSKTAAPVSVASKPAVIRARGEIHRDVFGKNAIFKPEYANIAAIEDHFDMSLMELIGQIGQGRFRISTIVPILVLLNDGDPIDDQEMFAFFADQTQDSLTELLSEVIVSLLDPNGRRFTVAEVESSPN